MVFELNTKHIDEEISRLVHRKTGRSLEAFVSALKHKDGIINLESRAKLDAHYLDYVSLCQQQESLPINHLWREVHLVYSLPRNRNWGGGLDRCLNRKIVGTTRMT